MIYDEIYKNYLQDLFPNGVCDFYEKCDVSDKDNYYCHDFCPYVSSFDDFVELCKLIDEMEDEEQ
jgi:hypothetical protein